MKPGRLLTEYGALVALIVLLAVNVATRGANFLQIENLRNLISQSAPVGVIAIGMTFVIISGGIDLSVGSMTAMCGAVLIITVNKLAGKSPMEIVLLAGLAAVFAGALAGFLNGIVIAYGRVAAFVVTLAGLGAFRSIALVLGKGGEIRSDVPSFSDFGFGGIAIPFAKGTSGGPVLFYWSALIFVIVAVLASILLTRTRFGRYVIAVGANRKAAEYSGIDTKLVRVAVYAIVGGCVGIAALLDGGRMNSIGTGSSGLYYELDAIAAVVIGGTSLRGGRGHIWGTVVGILLLTLILNMITADNIDTNWQGLVRGAVILVAVLIQRGSKEDE